MKQKNINIHTSKVVAALISSGWYPLYHYDINRKDEYCEISLTELIFSPYSKLIIYEDGIVHYFHGESLQYEGMAKSKNSIMKDILNK